MQTVLGFVAAIIIAITLWKIANYIDKKIVSQ